MKKLILNLLMLALPLAAFSAPGLVKPGEDAPTPQVLKWVKGTPITEFKKGQIYAFYYLASW